MSLPIHALSTAQRYRLLADHALEQAMIVSDMDGAVVDWSPGAERLLGWRAADMLGQPLDQVFEADERTRGVPRAQMGQALEHGQSRGQHCCRHRSGAAFLCDAELYLLRDGAGQGGAPLGFGLLLRHAQQDASNARAAATHADDRRIEAEASQERLRRAEGQLRVATEAARLGIWTWEVEHDRGTWENAEMYRIFGVPIGHPIVNGAQLIADYLEPDAANAFRTATEATVRDGSRFSFTGRIRHPDWSEARWIEVTGELAARAAGEPRAIIGTIADITERKEIESTLEESRVRLAATLAAGEVGTWIWDIGADRITGDRNLARLFGMPDEVAGGAPLATFIAAIHPDDAAQVVAQIRRAIERDEAYSCTYRIRHAGGGYRWVNARGAIERDAAGKPLLLAGVILDITRQKETQDALSVAEERYRTLITSMDEAFAVVKVIVDADGNPVDYRFEQVNRAIQEQSGLVDAAGKTIREMVPDIEQRWIDIYGRVALTREAARFTEHSAAMGYWWDVYATPIGHPDELRIAILFTDITARRQAEEKLRQTAADLSESNRRKTEFLATLAHELRNPLAPMRTGLDLIRMATRDMPSGARVLEMMDRQLRQMVHLIDDLMDVSRINSGKIVLQRQRVDLRDAIANAVESALPAVEAARHVLRVEVLDTPMEVDVDPTRLAQILGNLLANAVKYTPPGGHILVSAWRDGAALRVAVKDSGMGIAVEEQARVFDMFSQVSRNMGRAQGGLGIGLSLVRSLLEMHGGSIAVESAGAEQGSTFTMMLPGAGGVGGVHAVTPAADAAPAAAEEKGQGQGLLVVVADDNVDAAEMLGALLQASGHRIVIVHDGVLALQAILAQAPEVAILDIGMPGLSGYEVARQVRASQTGRATTLIALTGWGGELDRSRSDAAGFDAHLTKPAGLEELTGLLDAIAARRGAA